MKLYCVFSLESPWWDDSNEHKQYTFFNIKKENHPKLSLICSYGIFFKGLKNEFKTAMQAPLGEPLKAFILHEKTYKNLYFDEKKLYFGNFPKMFKISGLKRLLG